MDCTHHWIAVANEKGSFVATETCKHCGLTRVLPNVWDEVTTEGFGNPKNKLPIAKGG